MNSTSKRKNPTIIKEILKILSHIREIPNDYESNQTFQCSDLISNMQINDYESKKSLEFQFSDIDNSNSSQIENEFLGQYNNNFINSPIQDENSEKSILVFNADFHSNYINENYKF